MGCIQSSNANGAQKEDFVLQGDRIMKPRASVGGTPLTPKEIQMRIESSGEILSTKVGFTTINYAYITQRGYYPDALLKPNQDSLTALPELSPNRAFFAVYDGHGRDGHDCAYYCRDHVSHDSFYLVNKLLIFSFFLSFFTVTCHSQRYPRQWTC